MSAKVIPDKIHLKEFRIVEAEIKSPEFFGKNEINHYNSVCDFNMAFNLEDGLIKANLIINVHTVSNSNTNLQEAKVLFEMVYIFHIENFKDLAIQMPDDTLDLKGGLANAIASIAYSTSRGVLMTRLQGTVMSEFILPVIDPNELIAKK